MTENLKLELWDLALAVAMTRLGLVPLQRDGNDYVPPKAALAAMPVDEARKAKRKYRKLWRRSLARDLKVFEATPQRVRKWKYCHRGVNVRGSWKGAADALEGQLLEIEALDVGRRPSCHARGYRWVHVRSCPELRKELLRAAMEFGLCPERRNM